MSPVNHALRGSAWRVCLVIPLAVACCWLAPARLAADDDAAPRARSAAAPQTSSAASGDASGSTDRAEGGSDAVDEPRAKPRKPPIRSLLRNQVDPVIIENAPARIAVKYWADTTGVPLVVNWRRLEQAGVDPDTLINLNMRYVPADELLSLILEQTGGDMVRLTFHVTDWYVLVLSRKQALTRVERRVYPVEELLFVVPNFTGAPRFDLSSAMESGAGNRGDRSRGSDNASLFDTGDGEEVEMPLGKTHRGEELAQLIRDTIEPDIWRTHGGEHASIQYYNGRLVVTAPAFVHAQIGLGHRPTTVEDITGGVPYKTKASIAKPDATDSGGPAAIQRYDAQPVSGVR